LQRISKISASAQKRERRLRAASKRNTITELLPVVDNFERARSQKQQTDAELVFTKATKVFINNWLTASSAWASQQRPEGSLTRFARSRNAATYK